MSERMRWPVDVLALRGGERVLEIGCGHGVAITSVAERLSAGGGHVVALDRSAKMVEMARARNAAWVEAGIAEVRLGALGEVEIGEHDVVFAVNVGALWRGGARELRAVLGAVAPGGRAWLFYETPGWKPGDDVDVASSGLVTGVERVGGTVRSVARAPAERVPMVGVEVTR